MLWQGVLVAFLVSCVYGASALRRCCRDPDAVLLASDGFRTATCSRPASNLAPYVWALEGSDESGPPPECSNAGGRTFAWVLFSSSQPPAAPLPTSPDQHLPGGNETTPSFDEDSNEVALDERSPPSGWQNDAQRFCAEVLVNESPAAAAAAAFFVVVLLCGSGARAERGVDVSNETSGAKQPPWSGGSLLWLDAAGGGSETELSSPSSHDVDLVSEETTPEVLEEVAFSVVTDPAVEVVEVAVVRKCCPRGEGVNLELRTCEALRRRNPPQFPPRDAVAAQAPGSEEERGFSPPSLVVVGPVEAVARGSKGACPKDTARVFQRVTRVLLHRALPNATQQEIVGARDSCVDVDVASSSAAPAAVVARCVPVEIACGAPRGRGVCVSKCCPVGHSFVKKECRRSAHALPLQFKASFAEASAPGGVAFQESNLRCKFYPLEPSTKADDIWHLQRDGRVFRPLMSRMYMHNGYCVEHVDFYHLQGVHAFVCFKEDKKLEFDLFVVYPLRAAALLLSAVALALTLATYCLLPPLRNLGGKTVMSQTASQLAAFLCLASTQMISLMQLRTEVCKVIGYVLLYWLHTNFTWLNVLSFDIWWTFGAVRGRSETGSRARDRRRFLLYSLFAWGLPALFCALAVALNEGGEAWHLRFELRPNIAVTSCFFVRGTLSRVLYHQIPAALMVGVNIVLFVLTARRCSRIKAEMARLTGGQHGDSYSSSHRSHCHSNGNAKGGKGSKDSDEGPTSPPLRRMTKFRADCDRFLMNAKLFMAMGVPWVLDVISDFIIEPQWVWYLPEALLSLQGVFIFCIFVLKRKVLVRLRRRLALSPCGPCFSCCLSCCTCGACGDATGAAAAAAAAASVASTSTQRTTRASPSPSLAHSATARRHLGADAKQAKKSASAATLSTVTSYGCGDPRGGRGASLRHSPSPSPSPSLLPARERETETETETEREREREAEVA